jgi:hypothetical protein
VAAATTAPAAAAATTAPAAAAAEEEEEEEEEENVGAEPAADIMLAEKTSVCALERTQSAKES